MVSEDTDSIPDVGKKSLSRNKRQMLLQIGAAMLILVCGIVIGAGGALLHFKENIVPDRLPPSREIVRDMQARYNLTQEQIKKAEAALATSRDRMHAQFVEMREKMDAEFKQLSAAMKDILTPEQFARWENDFKSRRRRGPDRFGPGGPGRRGPGGPGPGRFGAGRPGPGGPNHKRPRPARPESSEPNSGGQ